MIENKKITELTSATLPLAGTEEIAIVQGGETKKVSVSEVGSGGSSAQNFVWSQSAFGIYPKGANVWVKQVSNASILSINETTSQTNINLLTQMSTSWVYQIPVDCYVKDIRFYTNGSTTAMLGIIKTSSLFTDKEIIKNIQPADLVSGGYIATDIAEDVLLSAGDFIHIYGGSTASGTSAIWSRLSIIFKPV